MDESRDLTFQQAARELRASMKRSQQSMATFLGVSIAALRNYESGIVETPDARAAAAYMLVAETCGRPDLVQIFGSALHRAMGIKEPWGVKEFALAVAEIKSQTLFMETVNPFEKRMVTALLACLRGQGPFKNDQRSVMQALAVPLFRIEDFQQSLRFLPKEKEEDQLMAFDKAVADIRS